MFKPAQFRDLMIAELAVRGGVAQPRDVAAALQRYWDDRDSEHITLTNEIARIAGVLPEVLLPVEREVDRLIAAAEGDAMRALVTEQLSVSGTPTLLSAALPTPVDLEDARRSPLRTMADGRYSKFLPVGEGGMGIVYWALDTEMNRQIALKVVRPDAAGSGPRDTPDEPLQLKPPKRDTPASQAFELLKARFLQEAWITGAMEHPGVVPVYELAQTPAGIPFYTMRFVRGNRTLAFAIDEARDAPFDERLQFLEPFLKVCDTLRYAHSKRILHRDLKPANVALGEFGEVVVLDWGLARLEGKGDLADSQWLEHIEELRSAAQVPPTAGPLGTPGYMSPEAAIGDLERIDERCDVYSLGAILFEILTARLPFEFRSFVEYVALAVSRDAPDVTEVAPDAPPGLATICASALARDPEERTPDVATLADQVRAWQTGMVTAREVDQLIQTARAGLTTARDLTGDARVRQLDRVGAVCRQAEAIDAESEDLAACLREVRELRTRGLRERERATRRSVLARAAAAALVVGIVAAVVVAGAIENKRHEAETAKREALDAEGRATSALGDAERERSRADERAQAAETASAEAVAQRERADAEAKEAERQRDFAEAQHLRAETEAGRAREAETQAKLEAADASRAREETLDRLAESYAQMARSYYGEGRISAAQLAAAKALTIRDTPFTRSALSHVSRRGHPTLVQLLPGPIFPVGYHLVRDPPRLTDDGRHHLYVFARHIDVHDADTGQRVRRLNLPVTEDDSYAVSPDGYVLYVHDGRTLKTFDLRGDAPRAQSAIALIPDSAKPSRSLPRIWVSERGILVAADVAPHGPDSEVAVVDIRVGRVLSRIRMPAMRALVLDDVRARVFASVDDNGDDTSSAVQVWDGTSGELLHRRVFGKGRVTHIVPVGDGASYYAVHSDQTTTSSGSSQKPTVLAHWPMTAGSASAEREIGLLTPEKVTLDSDGVTVWWSRVNRQRLSATLEDLEPYEDRTPDSGLVPWRGVRSLGFRPSDERVLATTDAGVFEWSPTESSVRRLELPAGGADAASDPNARGTVVDAVSGTAYAFGQTRDENNEVDLLYVSEARAGASEWARLFDLGRPDNPWTTGVMQLSRGGDLLFARLGATIKVWDTRDRQVRHTLHTRRKRILRLASSRDGRVLAAVAVDNPMVGESLDSAGPVSNTSEIVVWDLRSGESIAHLANLSGATTSVALAPDGARLYAGCADGRIDVWDLQARRVSHRVRFGRVGVADLCVSADGGLVAAAYGDLDVFGTRGEGYDRNVVVWRASGGQPEYVLDGHEAPVDRVRFGEDARVLYTTDRTGSIYQWRLPLQGPLGAWEGNVGAILALAAMGPDRLVSASGDWFGVGDGATRLWDVRRGVVTRHLRAFARYMSCSVSTRDLIYVRRRDLVLASRADL